jgi:prolyl oligopeptidase PreP (S9A serine peptidase family)
MKFTFAFTIAIAITTTAVVAQTASARNWIETSSPYQKLVEGVNLPMPWYVPSTANDRTNSSHAPEAADG